jgi:hypothetical protein
MERHLETSLFIEFCKLDSRHHTRRSQARAAKHFPPVSLGFAAESSKKQT